MGNNSLILFNNRNIVDILATKPNNLDYIKFHSWSILNEDFNKWLLIDSIKEFTSNWIKSYIGGGVFDSKYNKKEFLWVVKKIKELWLNTVEINSCEWKFTSPIIFSEVMKILCWEFEKVLVEIWIKSNCDIFSRDYKPWINALDDLAEFQVSEIVIEWGMWICWIYSSKKYLKILLLFTIIKKLIEIGYQEKFIIESALNIHQYDLINLFWSDVKLWNITTNCVNIIEDIRQTSKGKQNFFKEFSSIIDEIFDFCKKYKLEPNYFLFNEEFYFLNNNYIKAFIKTIKNEISSIHQKLTDSPNPSLHLENMAS